MMAARLTSELLALLASPDPHERDDIGYTQLVERVTSGSEDGKLEAIGDYGVSLLAHTETQARTFGALALAEAVARDLVTCELQASTVQRWQGAVRWWYLAETDLRGWDPTLGWLHAVAHGADALGAFARSRHSTWDDLLSLLQVGRDRVLTSGETLLFANAEEDRLGFALALVLTRPELSEKDATAWLDPVRAAFAAGTPGPVPAWVSNTVRTLRSIYVFADRGVLAPGDGATLLVMPHRHAVTGALAKALRETFPYLG